MACQKRRIVKSGAFKTEFAAAKRNDPHVPLSIKLLIFDNSQ